MRELTSFDHIAIASEMERLVGRHFQKLSSIPGGYKLKLRSQDILIHFPDKVYPTVYSVPSLTPDNFSLRARKILKGARLTSVEVINLDRVVKLSFGDYSLVLELFREGNLLLLEGPKILEVLHPGEWRHRTLKPGVEYSPPPPPSISTGTIVESDNAIRSLVRSGIPKPYAYEILHRIDHPPSAPLRSHEEVLTTLQDLLRELRSPSGYLCEGEPYPIRLSYVENCQKVYDTFSEALDSFTPMLFTLEKKEEERPTKLDYMLRSLEEIESEISQIERLINYIYEHWSEVESALHTGNFSSLPFRVKGREGRKIRLEFTP